MVRRWNFGRGSHQTRDMETSGLAAAILNLPLPVTCDSVGNASVEKFTPENGGVAAEIFVLSPTGDRTNYPGG